MYINTLKLLAFLIIYILISAGIGYAAFPAARTNIDNNLPTASSVRVVDLDLDGDMDIVATSNALAGNVVWYENNGSNNFTLHQINTALLNGALSAYPVDLDRDGDIDIVAAENGANNVVWYQNGGGNPDLQANWTVRQINTALLNGAISTYPIDLDRDGDIDVVAAGNIANTVVWYESDQNQNNNQAPINQANWTVRQINTAALNGAISTYPIDLDRDGDIDVVAAENGANNVVWYQNGGGNPDLQANWTVRQINTAPLNGAISTYPIDLDRDGDIDVVAAGTFANSVIWYESDQNQNNNQAPINQANWTLGNIDTAFNAPVFAASSDIDGDGDFDILAAGNAGANEEVSWWESDGTPRNGGWIQHILDGAIGNATSAAANDIDRDGDMDIVESAANQVAWFPDNTNRTSGNIGFKNRAAIASGIAGARSGFVDDIDSDGEMDVAAVSNTANTVSWWRNDGTESFTKYDITTGFTAAWHVFTVDLDIDGDKDVVASSRSNDAITWYESDGTPLNGGWTAHSVSAAFNGPYQTLAVDLDQDGDLDLVSVAYDGAKLSWWESDGTPRNGGWTEHTIYTSAASLSSVKEADIDKDGDWDLVVSSDTGNFIKWFESDGTPRNGGWTERDVGTAIGNAFSVRIWDINKDGDIDIAAALRNTNQVAWWESDGTPRNGGWTIHYVTRVFNNANSVCVDDIDRDGDPDIFGTADKFSDVSWWASASSGTTWTERDLDYNFVGPNSTFTVDLDKDGDVDLISCASTSNEIAWWENVPVSQADTPAADAVAAAGVATIAVPQAETGIEEGGIETQITPEEEDEKVALAEKPIEKVKREVVRPIEKEKVAPPEALVAPRGPEIAAEGPTKPVDYDNMLVLHYVSGEKLIVLVNPAKKKTIALFFEKGVKSAEEIARRIFNQ